MRLSESANLIQAELIRHYHSRQSTQRDSLSLEDAAREWILKRAAKFRAYWKRRPVYGGREFATLRIDRPTPNVISRCE